MTCSCGSLLGQGNKAGALGINRLGHLFHPMLVVRHVQAFIFRLGATEDWLQIDTLGPVVRAFNPVLGATAHVVPFGTLGVVALLASAELFQVIRRAHAGHVEEVFVLADALGAVFGGFTLGCPAVDGDLGLVDVDRAQHPDLGGELVHHVDVRVQAQVLGGAHDEVGLRLTHFFFQALQLVVYRAYFRVGQAGPQHHVAVLEGVEAAFVGPALGVYCLGAAFLVVALAHSGQVVPVHGAYVVAVGAVFGSQLPNRKSTRLNSSHVRISYAVFCL